MNLSVDAFVGGLGSVEPVGAALIQLIPLSLKGSTAAELFFENNLDERRAKNERVFFINIPVRLYDIRTKKGCLFTKKLCFARLSLINLYDSLSIIRTKFK
jgi:hypothetical protein